MVYFIYIMMHTDGVTELTCSISCTLYSNFTLS